MLAFKPMGLFGDGKVKDEKQSWGTFPPKCQLVEVPGQSICAQLCVPIPQSQAPPSPEIGGHLGGQQS